MNKTIGYIKEKIYIRMKDFRKKEIECLDQAE